MATKKMTLEQSLTELEAVVRALEEGNLELDESIKLYEKGVKLTNHCRDILENAKLKITELTAAKGSEEQGE